MCQISAPLTSGSFLGRGGRRMAFASVGSKASAMPRVAAVIRLIQRICTAVIGRVRPKHEGRHDGRRLADIRGQRPADDLLEVVVDRPPLADRRDDRGEIVVGEHQLRGFLGHLRTLPAHGDAGVGALQRGGVVDPVAGHRHHVAVGLQGCDQPELMLRTGAGEDVGVVTACAQPGFILRVDLAAGDDTVAVAQADQAADRRRGPRMVAGDHLHGDPGRVALGDGGNGLRPRRVDEADQAEKQKAAVDMIEIEFGLIRRHLRGREREDAFAAIGDPVRLSMPSFEIQRLGLALGPDSRSHMARICSGAPLTNAMPRPSPARFRVAMKR